MNRQQQRPPLNTAALARLQPIPITQTLSTIAASAVQHHPVKLSLNFLGLALLFLLPGLTPSEQQNQEYVRLQPSMAALERESAARHQRDVSYASYRQSQGWFWTCDATCSYRKGEYEGHLAAWQEAHSKVENQLISANSQLGVFSAPAVEETRDLFWGTFGRGMAVAKRMSMWDVLFVGMRSMGRDEGLASFLVDMAFRVLMNVSVGMFTGVCSFLWQVYSIIRMYGGGVAGMLFFAACLLSGVSFLATTYTVMFGGVALAGVGAFNLMITAAQQQQRVRDHPD